MEWRAEDNTSPFRIVSQSAADRNIPDGDCCGETVNTAPNSWKAEENGSPRKECLISQVAFDVWSGTGLGENSAINIVWILHCGKHKLAGPKVRIENAF